MSTEPPSAREAHGDAARQLLAAARERFAVASVDLLLPDQARLTEWQRITAAALLAQLVQTIESALRAELAAAFPGHEAFRAALGSAHVPIVLPILERANILRDIDLGTVLVRRVEEHRFHREQQGAADALLLELIGDDDATVAAAAMALLIARSRRFDRFNEPLMDETELAAELQHKLVWIVAAALRQYAVRHHHVSPAELDSVLAAAATAQIGAHDEGESLEARASRLAAALDAAERLDDALVLRVIAEGDLPLFVAALGRRAGLAFEAAWEVLSDPRGKGPPLLLRASDVTREAAAAILLSLNTRSRLFSGREGDAAAAQLDRYDAIDVRAARATLRLWQADPGYRSAIARLSTRVRSAEAA